MAESKKTINKFNPISTDYWKDFYKKNEAPEYPSDFAKFCLDYIPHAYRIIDIGCGNGRDTNFFRSKGMWAIGIDKAFGKDFREMPLDGDNVYYSRFFLHSIYDDEIKEFIGMIRKGFFMAEFRLKGDKDFYYKNCPEHDRNLLELNTIERILEDNNFAIKCAMAGRGLAKYKTEDPLIGRIVARK